MLVLLEKSNSYNSIEEARADINKRFTSGSQQPETAYNKLNNTDRYKYIKQVIQNLKNYNLLKPIESDIISSIEENG